MYRRSVYRDVAMMYYIDKIAAVRMLVNGFVQPLQAAHSQGDRARDELREVRRWVKNQGGGSKMLKVCVNIFIPLVFFKHNLLFLFIKFTSKSFQIGVFFNITCIHSRTVMMFNRFPGGWAQSLEDTVSKMQQLGIPRLKQLVVNNMESTRVSNLNWQFLIRFIYGLCEQKFGEAKQGNSDEWTIL